MSLANKLENTYLNILRYLILAVATISMIVVFIAGFMALSAAFSSPPREPVQVKLEDRFNKLNKGFNIKNFRNDNASQSEEKPKTQLQEQKSAPVEKPAEDPFLVLIRNRSEKIADNFASYMKIVQNTDSDKEQLQRYFLSYPSNMRLKGDKNVYTFYFETLNSLSEELVKQAPEMAKLSDNKKIDPDKLLSWHLKQINQIIASVHEENDRRETEFKEKQVTYYKNKTSIYKYAITAASALGIFLCIIMLFVMVKIERNLRPLQQIVDGGKGSSMRE